MVIAESASMYLLICVLLSCGIEVVELANSPFKINFPSNFVDSKKETCAALEKDISYLNKTLAATNIKVDILMGNITASTSADGQFKEIIKAVEEKQTELSSQLTLLSSTATQGSDDGKVSHLEEEVKTINTSLESVRTSLDTLSTHTSRQKGVEASVKGLQTTQKTLENQLQKVAELTQALDTKVKEVSSVQAEMASLRSTQDKLTADTSGLAALVKDIKVPDVSGIEKRLELLTESHQTSSEKITELEKGFKILKKDYKELSSSMRTVSKRQSEISALDLKAMATKLTTLQDQVNTLANDIAAAGTKDVDNNLNAKLDSLADEFKTFKIKLQTETKTTKSCEKSTGVDEPLSGGNSNNGKSNGNSSNGKSNGNSSNEKSNGNPNNGKSNGNSSNGKSNGNSGKSSNRSPSAVKISSNSATSNRPNTTLHYMLKPRTFASALDYCMKRGGSLAVLDTMEKLEQAKLVIKGSSAWVGIRRSPGSSFFRWVATSQQVTGLTWKEGYPRQYDSCGYVETSDQLYFKAGSCTETMSYLCEK